MAVKSSLSQTSTSGMLFDMDGTLLGESLRLIFRHTLLWLMPDSTPAVLATWEYYAKEYNLDLSEVLRSGLPRRA